MKKILDCLDISVKDFILCIIIFIIFGLSSCNNAIAQSRNGNNFVAEQTVKSAGTETKYTYTDTDGKVYPIFITKNGRCYINRISKKSGKEYKKYLPEDICRTICKELGIEYKEK